MMLQATQSIVWVVAALLATMPQFVGAQRSDSLEVEFAIERLWSADEGQARAAKERLVDLGSVSVQPVVSLLSSVWKDGQEPHQKQHFARGEEREGAMAWARHEAGADDGEKLNEAPFSLPQRGSMFVGKRGAVPSAPAGQYVWVFCFD